MARARFAILISGRGSNMEAILRACADGRVDADVVLVASNNPDAAGLAVAKSLGAPVVAIPGKGSPRDEHEARLLAALAEARPDFVLLAGYMRILSASFVEKLAGRIVNIHPSLLPSFVGLDAQGQAHAANVRIAGCTTHFVTADLDAGPIIMQAAVPIPPGATVDDVKRLILAAEHALYPATAQALATGRARLVDGRVEWRDATPTAGGMIVSP